MASILLNLRSMWLPLAALLLIGILPTRANEPRGVVVESVPRDSPARRAGMDEGDHLLSWARLPNPPANPDGSSGELTSIFDWMVVSIEEAPRGTLVLERDGGEPLSLPVDLWEIEVRPALGEESLRIYRDGLRLVEEGDLEGGVTRLEGLGRRFSDRGDLLRWAWIRMKIGKTWLEARRFEEARASIGEALLNAPGDWRARATLRARLARAFFEAKEYGAAAETFGEAAGTWERSLGRSHFEGWKGYALLYKGDLDGARDSLRQYADDLRREAPGSLEQAQALNWLGNVNWFLGNMDTTERLFLECLGIRERLIPDSRSLAAVVNNLGAVKKFRGDLAGAEKRYREAWAVYERTAPRSLGASDTLNNLGTVCRDRGDYAEAERFFRRSLDIIEEEDPESLNEATLLMNLGNLALLRRDFDTAEIYHQKALRIREKVAPESIETAQSLISLGVLAHRKGDLDRAGERQREALHILEAVAPDSRERIMVLVNQGNRAMALGRFEAAEAHFREALELYVRIAPGGIYHAQTLNGLAECRSMVGAKDEAGELFLESLEILESLAPGSMDEAKVLNALGRLRREAGADAEALAYFSRAVDSLESQVVRLGGTDVSRTGFALETRGFYLDLIETLLTLGKEREAFEVLERSRARALLQMLAERDLVFEADIPPELERDRRMANAEYDRYRSALAVLSPERDAERIASIQQSLGEIRIRRDEIRRRIREASPRLALLHYPEPIGLNRARRVLDPGTLLLSYSVGEEGTVLFAVGPGPEDFSTVRIPLGEEVLGKKVRQFRRTIEELGEAEPGSMELSRILLDPVRKTLERSDRVLISPDGPLHFLPFAALRDPCSPGGGPRYFVEGRPLHTVLSATLYGEVRGDRRAREALLLVGFGDPAYGDGTTASEASQAGNRVTVEDLAGLQRLPATRREVEVIAGIFPGEVRIWLGSEASEERAKGLGIDVSHIHFACHSFLDDRFPLDSGLTLTPPKGDSGEGENGLLQAWEIFEEMRIDADLVVLSACETAMGKESGGEGLIGLARAFQYAGARSIVASLWSVADVTTADLMRRLYGYLREGKSKDQALRLAQVDLIRHSIEIRGENGAVGEVDASHPFHWAAFELIGDWR